MISIVDYGLGNIQAFLNVYKRINIEAMLARNSDDLRTAAKIILPGVGHFDHAMRRLEESGMREALDEMVIEKEIPVLGVCVGMQMLGKSSEEGDLPGLGWIDGHVRSFASWEGAANLPLPHMGWNDVQPKPSPLFADLQSDARFYFLHSFFFECADADDALATSRYGTEFSSAVNSRHIFGVQFHPEKSHHFGTRLLKNFAEF